jgi:hypothetical protein
MEVLVEHGADLHACDKYGSTALHYAAVGGCISAIDWLLQRGANIVAEDQHLTPFCSTGTAYHRACSHQQLEAMAALRAGVRTKDQWEKLVAGHPRNVFDPLLNQKQNLRDGWAAKVNDEVLALKNMYGEAKMRIDRAQELIDAYIGGGGVEPLKEAREAVDWVLAPARLPLFEDARALASELDEYQDMAADAAMADLLALEGRAETGAGEKKKKKKKKKGKGK